MNDEREIFLDSKSMLVFARRKSQGKPLSMAVRGHHPQNIGPQDEAQSMTRSQFGYLVSNESA
jgi:hypothetical protein